MIAQARLAAPLSIAIDASRGVPDEIQFMPPGRQRVAPFVNGEPLEMEITVAPSYAEVFDRACQAMLAAARSGAGDFPFTDFNHDDGAASSRPRRFYWGGDDPKRGGVRMVTAWTGSGKEALLNGDFLRFSPQWVFHKTTFEPLGLPCNVGGLVNRAAFKTIAPVASAGGVAMHWQPGVALDGRPGGDCGGLPQQAIMAAAREMRRMAPDRFASVAQAMEAYLHSPAGNRDYLAYRRAVVCGHPGLPKQQAPH